MNKADEQEPVSPNWAGFFSTGIFALLWTLKIKKTRRWLAYIILPYYGVVSLMFFGLQSEVVFLTSIGAAAYILGGIPQWAVGWYFLRKWCRQYNLDTFGYATGSEWEKVNPKPTNKSPVGIIIWKCKR